MAFRIPIGLQHALPPRMGPRHMPIRHFTNGPRNASIRAFSNMNQFFIPSSRQLSLSSIGPSLKAESRQFGKPSISSLKRAFSSSNRSLIRSTYFPKGSGGHGGSPPPSGGWFRNLRRRIDRIPDMTIIYALISANVGVFLLWQYAIESFRRFKDPSLYQFLSRNFVLNEANVMSGRIWTFLTSCFSHSTGSHIFVNCLGLYFVAPAAASVIGSSAFLGLYLGGGVFSTITSLLWHRAMGDRWAGSEGASGAIYSSLAFYGALFPNTTWLLFFVVPMPAWAMIGGIFAWDFYSAVLRPNSGTDSAGHMGGIIAGLGAAYLVRRRGLGAFRRRW